MNLDNLPYEIFYQFYDIRANIALKKEQVLYLKKYLLNYDDALVLDLACGTGNLTIELAKLGCKVIGVDKSPKMLAIAKLKAKDCKISPIFIQETFQSYSYNCKYNAVICSSFSLNYICDYIEITNVFTNIYKSLTDGGVFIFDMIYPNEAEKHFANKLHFENEDVKIFTSFEWKNRVDNLYEVLFSFFLKKNNVISKEVHLSKSYNPNEIQTILIDIGFQVIEFKIQSKLFKNGSADLFQIIAKK